MDISEISEETTRSREIFTLVYAVFVAGLCSIVYELLIATTVSYFEGDSVKFFSLTIGLYMAAMGLGAYVSKFMTGDLLNILIGAEILLGLVGGASIPALYAAFSYTEFFLSIYVFLTLLIGFLIGLEVPLLTRLLERYDTLRISIAHVLSLDYLGALIATVSFPFVLLPFLGIFRSSLFFGLLNMTIGLFLIWFFPKEVGRRASIVFTTLTVVIAASIAGAIVFSDVALNAWNADVYASRILHSQRTRYQQIVLTKYRNDVRMYLDGHIQFSSIDEYRYHESLVHVPLSILRNEGRNKLKVLLLGGGDGLGVREVIKYDAVDEITLVDLDPAIVILAKNDPYLSSLNKDSLTRDKRVRVLTGDAVSFLDENSGLYDVIIADLPDPNNTELARLYSREFFRLARNNLAPDGIFVTQSTSPLYASKAFWSIRATLAAEFSHTYPYHVLVPSFGDWGFNMASMRPLDPSSLRLEEGIRLQFLDNAVIRKLFVFANDLVETDVEISSIDRPQVLQYYLDGWHHWGR